jgi:hypothetical protein
MISANYTVTKGKDLDPEDMEIFCFYCYIPRTQFIALRSGKIETQRIIVRPELYKALVNFHG